MNETSFELAVSVHQGIHTRPAAALVQLAQQTHTEGTVRFQDKTARLSSIIEIMTLGVISGSRVRFEITGPNLEQFHQSAQQILQKQQERAS